VPVAEAWVKVDERETGTGWLVGVVVKRPGTIDRIIVRTRAAPAQVDQRLVVLAEEAAGAEAEGHAGALRRRALRLGAAFTVAAAARGR